jgi:poly(A)-specific ribonuclease
MKKVEKFIKDPEKESLSLPSFSPRVHELVYSCVKSAHKTGLRLESKKNEDNDRYIEITKWSEAENEKYDQEEVQIEQAVGFTKVISLLSKSGKVILGHNMLLDLLHMIRLFLSPLPDNLDDFKAVVKGTVPSLIDTKVMASTKPLKRHFPRSHLQGVSREKLGSSICEAKCIVHRRFSRLLRRHESS